MLLRKSGVFLNLARKSLSATPSRAIASRLSYQHGASGEPLVSMTFADILDRAASTNPQNVAVISRHQKIKKNFHEVRLDVNRLSAGLLSLGLEKGDRVALMSPSCYEWIVAQFAIACSGLLLVTVNPGYLKSEVETALQKAECRAIIIGDEFNGNVYSDMMNRIVPELCKFQVGALKSEKFPHLSHVLTIPNEENAGMVSLSRVMELGDGSRARELLDEAKKMVQPDDCINVQFTSGTTGVPKAARLSHHMLINNALAFGRAFGLTQRDRVCLPLPMFHNTGNVLGSTAMMCHRSSLVLPAPKFDAEATLDAIEKEECTVVLGNPTIYIDMLNAKSFAKRSFRHIRGGAMGGANCPKQVLMKLYENMNMKDICVGYGTTENSPLISFTNVSQPLEKRTTTVGKAMEHAEIKLIDSKGHTVDKGCIGEVCTRGYQVMLEYMGEPEKTKEVLGTDRWYKTGSSRYFSKSRGHTVDKGCIGEVCTRGYQVMLEYMGEPEKTKEVLGTDRWYKTGDLGIMDDEGYLKIVGRIKDIIIKGGENVYPREIEEFLQGHADIAEAQVFGIPDQRFGEVVCAWVKLRRNRVLERADLREFCRGRISSYKTPTHFRIVDEFPKNQSGKVQKQVMVSEMLQSVGDES